VAPSGILFFSDASLIPPCCRKPSQTCCGDVVNYQLLQGSSFVSIIAVIHQDLISIALQVCYLSDTSILMMGKEVKSFVT